MERLVVVVANYSLKMRGRRVSRVVQGPPKGIISFGTTSVFSTGLTYPVTLNVSHARYRASPSATVASIPARILLARYDHRAAPVVTCRRSSIRCRNRPDTVRISSSAQPSAHAPQLDTCFRNLASSSPSCSTNRPTLKLGGPSCARAFRQKRSPVFRYLVPRRAWYRERRLSPVRSRVMRRYDSDHQRTGCAEVLLSRARRVLDASRALFRDQLAQPLPDVLAPLAVPRPVHVQAEVRREGYWGCENVREGPRLPLVEHLLWVAFPPRVEGLALLA